MNRDRDSTDFMSDFRLDFYQRGRSLYCCGQVPFANDRCEASVIETTEM